MIFFLFGIVFGWLIGLTCFQFRKEAPIENVWKFQPTTRSATIDPGFFVETKNPINTERKVQFLGGDRVGEIIKGKKEDVRLDDVLV